MRVKVTAHLNRMKMFDFLMYHVYASFRGYVGLLISLCSLGAAAYLAVRGAHEIVDDYIPILILCGCMFTILEPIFLFLRSGKLVGKNGQFHEPITYIFSDTGIRLERNDQSASYAWEEVTKAVTTRQNYVVYCGTVTLIMPKEDMGDQAGNLNTLLQNKSAAKYIKIKE